jgi:hypothetical protein
VSVLDFVTGRSATPAAEIPADEIWEVFRNHRRRAVIQLVADMEPDDAVALGVLADHIARREFGPGFSSSERKTVYVGLYQTHLEKLDDVDAVNYDDERGVIRPGPTADPLADALDAVTAVIHR